MPTKPKIFTPAPRFYPLKDSRSYLEATKHEAPARNLRLNSSNSWLSFAVVVTLKLASVVSIANSILKAAKISFDTISIIEYNQVIVAFPNKESLENFFAPEESLIEYFSNIVVWDRGI